MLNGRQDSSSDLIRGKVPMAFITPSFVICAHRKGEKEGDGQTDREMAILYNFVRGYLSQKVIFLGEALLRRR